MIQSDIPLKVLTDKKNFKKRKESGKKSVVEEKAITVSKRPKRKRQKIDTGLEKIRAERKKRLKKKKKSKQLSVNLREENKKKSEASKSKKMEKIFHEVNGVKKETMSEISKFSEKVGASDVDGTDASEI